VSQRRRQICLAVEAEAKPNLIADCLAHVVLGLLKV
jgi:hypothetical protein